MCINGEFKGAYRVNFKSKEYALYSFRNRLEYDFDSLFARKMIFWSEWHSTYHAVHNPDLKKMVWYEEGVNFTSKFTDEDDDSTMTFEYINDTVFSFKIAADAEGLRFDLQANANEARNTVFAGDAVVQLGRDPNVTMNDRAGLLWMVPPAEYLKNLENKTQIFQNDTDLENDQHSFIKDKFKVTFNMKGLQTYVHDKLRGVWPTLNCYFILKGIPYVPISLMKQELDYGRF